MIRRTKIVGTIGPASSDEKTLRALIRAGLDVARLNFSHGSPHEHIRTIKLLRHISREIERPIGILVDLQGPKHRVGHFENGEVLLVHGKTVVITTENVVGNAKLIPVHYPSLPREVTKGDTIYLDDGLIELEVERVRRKEVICSVKIGGGLRDHKGLNLPRSRAPLQALTAKDKEDVALGIRMKVDFFALSFVQQAKDVLALRRILKQARSKIPVIAKIEKPSAVEQIDEIITVSDGIMIARGDLGIEMPPEAVPIIQKKLIRKANAQGKLVITATQMLGSMMWHVRPTRAEASDVANAVYDRTGAIMLSGETAAGKYPVESVETMSRIAQAAEQDVAKNDIPKGMPAAFAKNAIAKSVSLAVCQMAEALGAKFILSLTTSGSTALLISKYESPALILGVTNRESTYFRMSLYRNVYPILLRGAATLERMIYATEQHLLAKRWAKPHDLMVVTAGIPFGVAGTTNLIKVVVVGEKR